MRTILRMVGASEDALPVGGLDAGDPLGGLGKKVDRPTEAPKVYSKRLGEAQFKVSKDGKQNYSPSEEDRQAADAAKSWGFPVGSKVQVKACCLMTELVGLIGKVVKTSSHYVYVTLSEEKGVIGFRRISLTLLDA